MWLSGSESIVLGLLEWAITPLGRLLRRLVYPVVFKHLGRGAYIRLGVEFQGARRISIGDTVSLHRNVRIRSLNPNSSIAIANTVSLDRSVDIKAARGCIKIGNKTYIGPFTCLSGGDIKIGNHCLIASHSGIYANNHQFRNAKQLISKQGSSFKGIVIEDDCWLGSGVKVMDGVTIGKGSVIGAGTVVTKDIPSYSIAVGVPARVIGQRQLTTGQLETDKLPSISGR
ncbi:MAG: acyltransferase [Cyanothece sp. SIO1E1]|nr:acyltransferase [Cyanothece sp. SIO1E1]